MIARLDRLNDRLDTGLDRMLGDLRAMSEAQRRFRAGGEGWSPTQVAHHLLLVQSGIVGVIEKMRGRQAKRRTLVDGVKHQAVRFVLFCGIRVRNPAPAAAPDPEVTFDELEPRWASERRRLGELLETMEETALGEAGFKHPIAGPLTVVESLTFLASHLEHHLRQLARIRTHPDFPA